MENKNLKPIQKINKSTVVKFGNNNKTTKAWTIGTATTLF